MHIHVRLRVGSTNISFFPINNGDDDTEVEPDDRTQILM